LILEEIDGYRFRDLEYETANLSHDFLHLVPSILFANSLQELMAFPGKSRRFEFSGLTRGCFLFNEAGFG